ncbi:MAG TPA: caspase family protein [Micromonosporaceae bacterium]
MANRALLVGINNYPDPRNNLNSCVADTLAFKQILQDFYGFDSGAIQLLHNQDATLDNVRTGLDALFTGASDGDQIVFFQSSHGYRYTEGNTMVEVLCLYDQFLNDTELTRRTQSLPPNVLTVVLDSCHSGGMNKMFFPPGDVQVARAKVWQPPMDQAIRDTQLYAQVTRFKFFGRTVAGESRAVAKNMLFEPRNMPPAKSGGLQGEVDLNGALFAACLADQTAAAGSPPTGNLSAFTYGIREEVRPGITLTDLSQRVANRLEQLNMTQTPIAIAPPMHPELLTETFISMRPGDGGRPGGGMPQAPTEEFDPFEWLRDQLAGLGLR